MPIMCFLQTLRTGSAKNLDEHGSPAALVMARQPAVKLGIELFVALDAKTHLECNGVNAVHPADLAVAGTAINVPFKMGLMIEPAVIGNVHEPDPGNRGCSVKVMAQLHYLRMPGDDIAVAEKAFAERRNAWIG